MEDKPEKIPFYIFLKDQVLFSFAGVYSMYEDAEGKPQYYFAILTSEPNSFMKDIHRRMPVILEKKEEEKYLDPENKDFDALYKLISTRRFLTKESCYLQLNPIDGECCYRDARFSPDGKYVLFAYQRYDRSDIVLYYVPLVDMQNGGSFTPIELPSRFFSTAREKPQPALRPAE